MRRPKSGLILLPELLRTLLSKPTTVAFPFGELALPDHVRGRIEVDWDACRGCGLCTRDCPAEALVLEKDGDRFRLVAYQDRCAYCGQCELSCPAGALRLKAEFDSAGADRGNLTEIKVDKVLKRKASRRAQKSGQPDP